MKKKILVFCLFSIGLYCHSQSVYTLDLKKDIVIGTLSLGMFISPLFINNAPDRIPESFDRNDINHLDRFFVFPYNKTLETIKDIGIYSFLTLPVLSVIGNANSLRTWFTYGIMYAQAILLTEGTKNLIKRTVVRYRPYMYTDRIYDGNEQEHWKSFPSGSSAISFMAATFFSTTFFAEYPESKWRFPVLVGSYAFATGIGVLRIANGTQFVTDVLAGAVIGSFYGWIIPFLHRKNPGNNVALNIAPNGFAVSLKF